MPPFGHRASGKRDEGAYNCDLPAPDGSDDRHRGLCFAMGKDLFHPRDCGVNRAGVGRGFGTRKPDKRFGSRDGHYF